MTAALFAAAALALAGAAPGLSPSPSPAPSSPADPCAGGILSVIDRPTVADGACNVARGHGELEAGYSNLSTSAVPGLSAWPQAELRYGLGGRYEFKLFPPNVIRQSGITGMSDAGVGIKREFGYTDRWLTAADAAYFVDSGTHGYGAGGTTANVKFIATYTLTPTISLSGNVAATTHPDGTGHRYGSWDTTFVVTSSLPPRMQTYVELFGTTTDAPGGGGNYSLDGGVQYAPTDSIEFDLEETLQLKPVSGGRGRSFGLGLGIRV